MFTVKIEVSEKSHVDFGEKALFIKRIFPSVKNKNIEGVTIDVPKSGIIYVRGPSGSGKSLLLKNISRTLEHNSFHVSAESKSSIIDLFEGATVEQAMNILASFGLGEPRVMLSDFSTLSEGEQSRLELALNLYYSKDYIYIDEFTSKLDRFTAKIVAKNLAKNIRKKGLTAYIAGCNDDIIDYLSPNYIVSMDIYGKHHTEEYKKHCDVSFGLFVEEGTIEDYEKLLQFHYTEEFSNGIKKDYNDITKVLVVRHGSQVIAVRVLTKPWPTAYESIDLFKKINNQIVQSYRTIVHPNYRGCGLVRLFNNETIKQNKTVFTLSSLANYFKFYETIGYSKIENHTETKSTNQKLLESFINRNGVDDVENLRDIEYAQVFISNLPEIEKVELLELVKSGSTENCIEYLKLHLKLSQIYVDDSIFYQCQEMFSLMFNKIKLEEVPFYFNELLFDPMSCYFYREEQ
ncbi:DUF3788 family protein [Vibrio vulnificus]